jgi:50S ribosomal subunit-associated GTPase HflX
MKHKVENKIHVCCTRQNANRKLENNVGGHDTNESALRNMNDVELAAIKGYTNSVKEKIVDYVQGFF